MLRDTEGASPQFEQLKCREQRTSSRSSALLSTCNLQDTAFALALWQSMLLQVLWISRQWQYRMQSWQTGSVGGQRFIRLASKHRFKPDWRSFLGRHSHATAVQHPRHDQFIPLKNSCCLIPRPKYRVLVHVDHTNRPLPYAFCHTWALLPILFCANLSGTTDTDSWVGLNICTLTKSSLKDTGFGCVWSFLNLLWQEPIARTIHRRSWNAEVTSFSLIESFVVLMRILQRTTCVALGGVAAVFAGHNHRYYCFFAV